MTAAGYPRFGAADLERALAEARPALVGAVVKRVRGRGALGIAVAARTLAKELLTLIVSLDRRFARVHLGEEDAASGLGGPAAGGVVEALRARAEGARIVGVERVPGERAVRIELERRRESYSPLRTTLLAELFGPAPDAVLLDEGGIVLDSLRRRRPPGSVGARGRAPLQPPDSPGPSDQTSDAGYHRPERPPLFPDLAPDPATRAYSRALAATFAAAEEHAAREEAREALSREIARRRRKIDRAREALAAAIAAAPRADEEQRAGDLLLASLHMVRRGAREVTVPDWYAQGALRTIALDPRRSPAEQAERYFKAANKLRRGAVVAKERLVVLDRDAARLAAADTALAAETADATAIAASLGIASRSAKRQAPRAAGPRRFVSQDGLTLLVGRSGAENDRMTLREARGNDLFLHVQGFAGSHVIVRADGKKPVPLESMLDAAALAVHYSKARGRARAEVSVTPRKYVRKPRGARPGAVALERFETLVVAGYEGRLRRVLASAGGLAGEETD